MISSLIPSCRLKKTLWLPISALIALGIFILITILMENGSIEPIDNIVYNAVAKLISDPMTAVFTVITHLCSPAFLIILAISITGISLFHNQLFPAVAIPVNLLVSYLINEGFKGVFDRPRPDINRLIEIGGYSYPSGHSFLAASFYGFLVFLLLRHFKGRGKIPLTVLLLLIIPLIGLSRIYLGVHHFSDVIAGLSLGYTWLCCYLFLSSRLLYPRPENKGRKEDEI